MATSDGGGTRGSSGRSTPGLSPEQAMAMGQPGIGDWSEMSGTTSIVPEPPPGYTVEQWQEQRRLDLEERRLAMHERIAPTASRAPEPAVGAFEVWGYEPPPIAPTHWIEQPETHRDRTIFLLAAMGLVLGVQLGLLLLWVVTR